MRLLLFLLCGLAALSGQDATSRPATPGPLMIVGGGGVGKALYAEMLSLAGGEKARVLVVPQASRLEDSGARGAARWREAGARLISVLELSRSEAARKSIAQADVIWFGGGSQNRLMKRLREAEVVGAIRRRHGEGALLGGSSAGAAVMSHVMLTGEARLDRVARGTTETAEGLGLVRGAIIDQHFSQRRRFNRLLGAVMDRKALLGIGIDEKTAILVRGDRFVVRGPGNVIVVDARRAKVEESDAEAASAARKIALHVLRAGMEFAIRP